MKNVILLLALSLSSVPALAFKVFSPSALKQTTLAKIKNSEELVICMQGGMSATDRQRATLWVTKASLTWLRVLKQMESNRTFNIRFSCTQAHLRVTLMQGNGRSYAGPAWTNIYLSSPYGTWTHELGHAFVGLSDTYVLSGGRAGVCQRGEPESLMCWGGYGPRADQTKWSTLWGDDIKGMIYIIFELLGPTAPSPYINGLNLTSAFEVASPWPVSEERVSIEFEDDEIDISGSWPDAARVYSEEILCQTPEY